MPPHQDAENIAFDDIVTLIMAGEPPKTTTVAKAVMCVMSCKDEVVRNSARLKRQGAETLNYENIEDIYARPDFPDSAP